MNETSLRQFSFSISVFLRFCSFYRSDVQIIVRSLKNVLADIEV